jgi:hypothetical protein
MRAAEIQIERERQLKKEMLEVEADGYLREGKLPRP